MQVSIGLVVLNSLLLVVVLGRELTLALMLSLGCYTIKDEGADGVSAWGKSLFFLSNYSLTILGSKSLDVFCRIFTFTMTNLLFWTLLLVLFVH